MRSYHYSLRNNLEEHSSRVRLKLLRHFLWSGYRVVKCRCGCQMVEFGDPCSKVITKVALLFTCPGQMSLFAAFNILLELRVHPITQAEYGYRSRLRSRQQQKWRNWWQTWKFCWLICCWTTVNCCWTTVNCNCSHCVLSQWTWTLWLREKWNWVNEKVLEWGTWVPHVVHCSAARRCGRLLNVLGRILRSAVVCVSCSALDPELMLNNSWVWSRQVPNVGWLGVPW